MLIENEGINRMKLEIFLLIDDEIDEEVHVKKLMKTWHKYKRD